MNTTTPPPQGVPAGWYPDPDRVGSQRYWDGRVWTDQLAPSPQTQNPQTNTIGWARVVLFLGAVAIIVGSLAPWATSAVESVAGTESDGNWTVFAGVLALILVAARRVVRLNIVIGLIVGVTAVGKISSVNGYSVQAFGQTVHPASVGWGLWLVVIACAALIVGSWFYYDEVKTDRLEKDGD